MSYTTNTSISNKSQLNDIYSKSRVSKILRVRSLFARSCADLCPIPRVFNRGVGGGVTRAGALRGNSPVSKILRVSYLLLIFYSHLRHIFFVFKDCIWGEGA